MERLTTDIPNGNFETMLNFVYGKDGWAYIRHDGEHADVNLTDWVRRQCLLRGCDEVLDENPEEIDQRICDCTMEQPICPIAMAYCFAGQAVHMRSRLKLYEDALPLERAQELAQAEKDGRLVVLPCKVGDTVWTNVAMSGWYFRGKDKPYSARVVFVGLNDSDVMGRGLINVSYEKHDYMMQFPLSDIGKSVFLTREEAKAALKKREED